MGERQKTVRSEDMATTSTAVATVSSQLQQEPLERAAVLTLRPARPRSRKKVVWTDDTVDNEHMNKKKSKCCCIYEKPRRFDESDSESSDDECEHCFGHVERRAHSHSGAHAHAHSGAHVTDHPATEVQIIDNTLEPTATLTLRPASPAPPAPPAPGDVLAK